MERRSSLTCATHFALCSFIEGVQFTFPNSAGKAVRAIVLAEVLESRYGSRSNGAAWLETFMCNEVELVREARRMNAKATKPLVIIMMSAAQLESEGASRMNEPLKNHVDS